MSSSTHSWQIGAVKITRVIESENPVPSQFLFPTMEAEALKRNPWLQPHFATAEGMLVLSIHAFIIDDGRERIIVDTCVGNDKTRSTPFFNKLQGPFLQQLAAAGYPAERITKVLCTHLHVDHVGWNTRLVDGRWVPTFPNARYLFARTEFEHWSKETPDAGQDIMSDSVKPILDAGLADLVDTDHRISDAIWFEPTPGHTPGHVSVRVSSQGRDAVITGDLMHHPLQVAEPATRTAFDSDAAHADRTRLAFLERYADKPVLVLGTHFATPTAGHVVSHGKGRRFAV